MKKNKNGQKIRILKYLLKHKNREVAAIDLQRAGSGSEYGWCASLSRRISDIRSMGFRLEKTRDVWDNGKRFTFYTLKSTN